MASLIGSFQIQFAEHYTIFQNRNLLMPKVEMCGTSPGGRDQRLNPRLYDGHNSVNFCTSEVTLFEKKEPKSASRQLNKLKKRVLKNFLDEILNYRNAGPLSVPSRWLGPGPGPKN